MKRSRFTDSQIVAILWNAPGRMTAASVVMRAFAIAAPLPFLYATRSVETVAFWLSITTFQALAGAFAGIVPTVATQMVSYARAGSAAVGGSMADHALGRSGAPNWSLIARINRVTLRTFSLLAAAWLLFGGVIGTLIIWRPMMESGVVAEAALAWTVVNVGSVFRLIAQPYAAFAMGLGAVAEVRRREALAWLVGGLAAMAVLATVPNLALAMIAIQAPALANYLQFRQLAKRMGWAVTEKRPRDHVFHEVWTRAWRGCLATAASMLTIYGSGFIYAQVGTAGDAAAYLLGINILGIIGQVAFSPLTAASPSLSLRYAQGKLDEMTALAHRAISRSKYIFATLAIAAPILLACLNVVLLEPIRFPNASLWLAMSLSAILLRHSADHLFYFTTTNNIRGHIINPVLLIASLGPFLILPASNALWLVGVQGLAVAFLHYPYSRYLTFRHLGYDLRREVTDFIIPTAVVASALSLWLLPMAW